MLTRKGMGDLDRRERERERERERGEGGGRGGKGRMFVEQSCDIIGAGTITGVHKSKGGKQKLVWSSGRPLYPLHGDRDTQISQHILLFEARLPWSGA